MFRDVRVRVFLYVFIDSRDEVPWGFTQIEILQFVQKICKQQMTENGNGNGSLYKNLSLILNDVSTALTLIYLQKVLTRF